MDIIPSIMGDTVEEVKRQTSALRNVSTLVHLDVMDGHFVPEQTPTALSECVDPAFTYDIHLMVSDPVVFLDALHGVRARYIFAHAELSSFSLVQFFERAQEFEGKFGLAINPDTPVDVLAEHHHIISAVLVMSVQPGASGRAFDERAVEKIQSIKHLYPNLYIAVDGGINEQTLPSVKEANGAVVHSGLTNTNSSIIDAYNRLVTIARFKNH